MRISPYLLASAVLTTVYAQSSTITSSLTIPSNATRTNATQQVITTTITSLIPQRSGPASTSTLILTLTLNSPALVNSNSTLNSTQANGTLTNVTVPWNETAGYLPFHVEIDPAFGVLGALLIVSGIPVAVLGGKNRWSSLAIVTGYSLMLFTLVMILRFGIEPNLQPPSPNPPNRTLRGLYLLACIISSFFGAALGIFLYNFAKYWVSAAGGFAFGWFLLATRHGGLVPSTLGRWGLLGGLTVGAFVASLVPVLGPHMLLISTAWIGATAFVLGVDCYTRAGLKEFYVYNLGFHDLFPSLNGMRYPLTQTMEIELGILAAVVLIGAAIQFRVLNILQKRLKQMRDEEEAKVEAEEVAKAAERFKNVGSELNEWEEKHGSGGSGKDTPSGDRLLAETPASMTRTDRSSVVLPQLGFDAAGSSQLSLLPNAARGMYETVPLASPPLGSPGLGNSTPTTGRFSMMEELKSPETGRGSPAVDPELESKMKLLEEVKKAREEVQGSLDKLRAKTPTPSLTTRLDEVSRTTTPTPTLGGLSDGAMSRRQSAISTNLLETEPQAPRSEWDTYLSERKVFTPPSAPSPAMLASEALMPAATSRRSSYAVISGSGSGSGSTERRERTTSMLEPRVSDFSPREGSNGNGLAYPTSAAMGARRTSSFTDRPSTYHDGAVLGPPVILGSAASSRSNNRLSVQPQRTMTYDELAERHRKRLSKLQEPVTAKFREEVGVAEARERWERQKKMEREEMRRKESERGGEARPARDGGRQEVLKSTDEWRKSVVGGMEGGELGRPGQAMSRKRGSMQSQTFAN